jgi:hypothetical protein
MIFLIISNFKIFTLLASVSLYIEMATSLILPPSAAFITCDNIKKLP